MTKQRIKQIEKFIQNELCSSLDVNLMFNITGELDRDYLFGELYNQIYLELDNELGGELWFELNDELETL